MKRPLSVSMLVSWLVGELVSLYVTTSVHLLYCQHYLQDFDQTNTKYAFICENLAGMKSLGSNYFFKIISQILKLLAQIS
jgi:hypothetical protein